jgi:hypothetical protein
MKLRALITHPWVDRGWLVCTVSLLVYTVIDWKQHDGADAGTRRVILVAAALACLALGPVVRRPAIKWSALAAGALCLLAALVAR